MTNPYALPDLSNVQHHPALTEISEVIRKKARRKDKLFFKTLVAYYLTLPASTMRAKLVTQDRGEIPVNSYMLALAPSGFGKGIATYTVENQVMADFQTTFCDHVLPMRAETNMWKLANRRAAISGIDEAAEYESLSKEFQACGAYPFVFDGASEPAIKQIRKMLLIANAGSINFQVDEIGLNLDKSMEALRVYLELYDQGVIKEKLTKNSADNKRTKAIPGKTPANMLLFGTPSQLLDNGATERNFMTMLETGYARRCIFAWGNFSEEEVVVDIGDKLDEIFQARVDPVNDAILQKWSTALAQLADLARFEWAIEMDDDISKRLLYYQIYCEKRSRAFPENEQLLKAEMEHRYYKALKLAGAYAFIDGSLTLTKDNLYAAIKLVEESGKSFKRLLSQEAPYMKLARYIATIGKEVTHSDLLEALPFYKGSGAVRNEMITMATAWGYRQHIVLKKSFMDGIELFSGETLKKTSLDAIRISYSTDFAQGYLGEAVPFDQLHNLTQASGMHFCNHYFQDNHRLTENATGPFNMLILDIDTDVTLKAAHDLLADYVFMTYTTKRHTPDENRFRILIPTNYELSLDTEDYRQFMNNVMEAMPFRIADDASNQIAKKWMTNPKGTFHYNMNGKLFDVLPYVPRTSKNEQHKKELMTMQSLDNLERWFAQRIAEGSRNNNMIKFALALVDSGMSYNEVESKVLNFNGKLNNGLSQDELRNTVLVTAAKRIQARP